MKTKHVRSLIFAGLMSCFTVMLVSAAISIIHGVSNEMFFTNWFKSILITWPLVFVSILTVAPLINRLLGKIFRMTEDQR